ncbi:MAG: hypothetical protein J7J91_04040 [Deltaproteobacteria bacterium]|nr:hypothetical protein [Deltaproteobacteria bacterium]
MLAARSMHARSSRTGKYLVLGACCIFLVGFGLWLFSKKATKPVTHPQAMPPHRAEKRRPITTKKVINYNKMKKKSDAALSALMEKRKAQYGVEKSIDMIVKPDESIKIGKETVRMKKILEKVRLREGDILETDLITGAMPKETDEFGIHVVQPGENIWDIHFKLLKDYYDNKGIQLSPLADEPNPLGYSSGIGKILKFSEDLVYIYNIKQRKLDTDLNIIHPLSKIVIYNMSRVFSLLDIIDYKDVSRIEFDGETLWLPAEQ